MKELGGERLRNNTKFCGGTVALVEEKTYEGQYRRGLTGIAVFVRNLASCGRAMLPSFVIFATLLLTRLTSRPCEP